MLLSPGNSNARHPLISLLMTWNLIGAALNTLEFIEIPVDVVINMMHYPPRSLPQLLATSTRLQLHFIPFCADLCVYGVSHYRFAFR